MNSVTEVEREGDGDKKWTKKDDIIAQIIIYALSALAVVVSFMEYFEQRG